MQLRFVRLRPLPRDYIRQIRKTLASSRPLELYVKSIPFMTLCHGRSVPKNYQENVAVCSFNRSLYYYTVNVPLLFLCSKTRSILCKLALPSAFHEKSLMVKFVIK